MKWFRTKEKVGSKGKAVLIIGTIKFREKLWILSMNSFVNLWESVTPDSVIDWRINWTKTGSESMRQSFRQPIRAQRICWKALSLRIRYMYWKWRSQMTRVWEVLIVRSTKAWRQMEISYGHWSTTRVCLRSHWMGNSRHLQKCVWSKWFRGCSGLIGNREIYFNWENTPPIPPPLRFCPETTLYAYPNLLSLSIPV